MFIYCVQCTDLKDHLSLSVVSKGRFGIVLDVTVSRLLDPENKT